MDRFGLKGASDKKKSKKKSKKKRDESDEEGEVGGGGGGKKDALSIEETNKLRVKLGLKPLKM